MPQTLTIPDHIQARMTTAVATSDVASLEAIADQAARLCAEAVHQGLVPAASNFAAEFKAAQSARAAVITAARERKLVRRPEVTEELMGRDL